MKVQELIEKLIALDPDLEVCIFDDQNEPSTATGLGIYFGPHEVETILAIRKTALSHYVGIGYPGDCHYRIPPTLITDLD